MSWDPQCPPLQSIILAALMFEPSCDLLPENPVPQMITGHISTMCISTTKRVASSALEAVQVRKYV